MGENIPRKRPIRSQKISFKFEDEAGETMGKPRSDQSPRRVKKEKERWLLTRKTWRYMADAGRRLIPEGVHNRPEDVPKIEKYFQEVCQAEPKFLLWRKASYPGALGLRSHNRKARTRKKTGSCREKASSADEADDIKKCGANPCGGGLFLTPTTSGRFDLHKLAIEKSQTEDELMKQLKRFLESSKGDSSKSLNHDELFDKLEKYLRDVQSESRTKHRCDVSPDIQQRDLLDTLKRYYSKSPNRESVISNLLTDRKLLEKLYFDLRKTRNFRGAGSAYFPEWRGGVQHPPCEIELESQVPVNPAFLHPPLTDIKEIVIRVTKSTQTPPSHPDMVRAIEEKLKKIEEEAKPPAPGPSTPWSSRRRSSVDHDDVSPSVGDTIKRYLKMARKKSIDSDKADRFKTINYDKNLRNIKGKGIPMPGDDDGLNKGCQTEKSWTEALKSIKLEDSWVLASVEPEVVTEFEEKAPSSQRNSPIGSCESLLPPGHSKSLLSSGQSFLSNLLQGLQIIEKSPVLPAAMQKSKSSASVGRSLVSKKIWRGRSKSQSRVPTPATSSWTPQGNCTWSNLTGRSVTLSDTSMLTLSEMERRILQKVALAKLQALNLGCQVRLPSEAVVAGAESKPKRRAHLLKRKAITTSFFDTSRAKEKVSDHDSGPSHGYGGSGSGAVFGVSLSQCVENERVSRHSVATTAFRSSSGAATFPDDTELGLRRKSHHGSRSSFSSLIEPRIFDESAGSSESLGGSMGLLDSISTTGSIADVSAHMSECEPVIPNIVSACFRHIEAYGLHILGIFRVSSSKKRVRQLREDFDSGKEQTLGEDCSPHDVATLIKEYFRDLPEPLLCKDLYQPFLCTQKIRNRRLQYEAIQHLIQLLPVPNRDTLWALLNFLSLVAANADDHRDALGELIAGNRMDSNNLATLFAPNILHSNTSPDQMASQTPEERLDIINVIRTLIDHNKALFQITAELLDEVYVHMMDTNPEALDILLRKRDTDDGAEDLDSGVLEEVGTCSESSSLPATPRATNFEHLTDERRAYSREQFVHANAGYDPYNLDHIPRVRERDRERTGCSKKSRDSDVKPTDTDHPIAPPSRHRSQQDADVRWSGNREDGSKQSTVVLGNTADSGVIKASLTIPTSSFALNLDDSDIPFIEDSQTPLIAEGSRHHISIGVFRQQNQHTIHQVTSSTGRYRSGSGSDSSQTSTPVNLQPITGSLSLFQGRDQIGYDSAVGSSATFSSPPRNTTTPSVSGSERDFFITPARNTTPSVCSSSDRDFYSSPPSWTSSPMMSPPLSPSSITTMDYTPEELSSSSTIGRISIGARSSMSEETTSTTTTVHKSHMKSKETTKLTFTKTEDKKSLTKDLYQRVHSLVGGSSGLAPVQADSITKSSSSGQLGALKKFDSGPESSDWSRKVTTSISNIGGAVMRSKTADIERMLKIKPESKKPKPKTESKAVEKEKPSKSVTESDEKKKYAKRRYTDARHQTKTLIDPEQKSSMSSTQTHKTQSVWKRRELISSPINDDES